MVYCGKCGYVDHGGAVGCVCPNCDHVMTMVMDSSDIEYAIMTADIDGALEWMEEV